ncbi:MAG: hypothetical protein KAI77_09980, partial [Gammaproteobacteria bacterium]|nr:hypothetical protein [Gammaproteobacteria bacterium]
TDSHRVGGVRGSGRSSLTEPTERSHRARPQEVYELDFGGGCKVITFVTWTLERAHNHEH